MESSTAVIRKHFYVISSDIFLIMFVVRLGHLTGVMLETYSVTQSFANSFWRDVVLDTFNNVSRDENNILYQIYVKQICSDFYNEDLKFWEYVSMHFCIMLWKSKIIIIKIRTYLIYTYIFGLKCCLHP